MSASGKITPEEMHRVAGIILGRNGGYLLEPAISRLGQCLENGDVAVAKALIIEQPDGTFEFSALGKALGEFGAFGTLWCAVDLILADLRDRLGVRRAKMEVEHAKEN